jgi:tol-pal system protein YbgF
MTARISSVLIMLLCGMGLLLVFSGCATRKEIVGFKDDSRRIRADIDSLKQQQKLMMEALGALDSGVSEVKAKTEYGSSSLEEKVQALTARLDEILTRLDRLVSPLETYLRKQSATDTVSQGNLDTDFYDTAMNDLSKGNYDLAEDGFLQFLKKNPQSELADDARYGLAESYYARKMYDEAATEFQRVADIYPEGNKAPAALLKLGLTFKAQGKTREARETWENLLKKYPLAEEAKVARQRLNELKSR